MRAWFSEWVIGLSAGAPHSWAIGLALWVGFLAGAPFAVILAVTFFRSIVPR